MKVELNCGNGKDASEEKRWQMVQFYGKGTPSHMLSCEISEVYRMLFLLLQKISGRLVLIYSNICNVSLALSAINQFNHS